MKTLKESVGVHMWNSMEKSVWGSVRNSMKDSVRDSVRNSVRISVGNFMWDLSNFVWVYVVENINNKK